MIQNQLFCNYNCTVLQYKRSGGHNIMAGHYKYYIDQKEDGFYFGLFLGNNNNQSLCEAAFSGCSSLTSITIPSSVTNIGDHAFSGCKSLTSITIPSGVTSIGKSEFYNCSSLTSITIPSSVTNIGDRAFSGCKSLTSITIPSGITSIGNYAFPNKIVVLNFFVKDICSDLIPFGFSCPYPMDCMK